MTAEELAQLGYQPSMGSPALTQAAANVSPQDLQQFYSMAGGATPTTTSLTPDQVDPAMLAQLMGTPAPQSQMDQVTANQLAMMGVPPPSDPNGLTSGPDAPALDATGQPLHLPPNSGAANTYGGTPPTQSQAPAPSDQQSNQNLATSMGFPQFADWAKAAGLPRQVMPEERKVILEKYLDQQKEFMTRQDPKALLETQKLQGEIAAQGISATKASQEQVDNAFKMDESLADVQAKVDFLDKLKAHPGLSPMVGSKGISTGFVGIPIPGTDAANFNAALKKVQGGNFLTAFNQLKGAGQITEIEGAKATQAISDMSTSQSEEEFKKSLDELQGVLRTGMERTKKHYAALPAAARAVVASTPSQGISASASASQTPGNPASRPAILNLKGVMYQLGSDGTYHRAR